MSSGLVVRAEDLDVAGASAITGDLNFEGAPRSPRETLAW